MAECGFYPPSQKTTGLLADECERFNKVFSASGMSARMLRSQKTSQSELLTSAAPAGKGLAKIKSIANYIFMT